MTGRRGEHLIREHLRGRRIQRTPHYRKTRKKSDTTWRRLVSMVAADTRLISNESPTQDHDHRFESEETLE